MTTTSTTDPVTHDTELVRLLTARAQAQQSYHLAMAKMRRVLNLQANTPDHIVHSASWEILRDFEMGETPRYQQVAKAQHDLDEASDEFHGANIDVNTHEDAYDGWSRFYLVTNTNGHIHSSLNCPTCFPTTQYAFLPQLSGQTEAQAVEEQGEILCSVCFPSAPVEWTNGTSKASQDAKAERAAAKAEREAKRLAKALLPDGSDLVIEINGYTERFKTLASAKTFLTDAAWWNVTSNRYPREIDGRDGRRVETAHPSYPETAIAQVSEAVATKTGERVEQVWADAIKRANKRR